MSSTPMPTTPRRSNRLAAKQAVSYAEPTEVPDELLMERTQAMFETLLEERLSAATRDLPSIYGRSRKEFLKLYADLPADDVERIAAETVLRKLPTTAYTHPIVDKYINARDSKRRKEDAAEIRAKVMIEKASLDAVINAYDKVLDYKAEFDAKLAKPMSILSEHAKILADCIKGERSSHKRTKIRRTIFTYVGHAIHTRRGTASSWSHGEQILSLINKGELPIAYAKTKVL